MKKFSITKIISTVLKHETTNRYRYDTNIHDSHLIPRIDMGKNYSKFKVSS